jgi:hypothetical protein
LGGVLLFDIFEWDEQNIEHILRHNVVPDEVEEACVNQPHVRKSTDKRYLVYGVTDSGSSAAPNGSLGEPEATEPTVQKNPG